MAKFHINPETGKAGTCTASERPCKYGESTPHFKSAAEAQTAYEDAMSDVTISTHSRSSRKGGLPPLAKPSLESAISEMENIKTAQEARIKKVQDMTNMVYVFAGKLKSDSKAGRGKHSRNPEDLKQISRDIDAILDDSDFSTVRGSETALERLEEFKGDLSRKADHFDAEGDASKSYTYYYASERLADLITENLPEAA